MDPNSTSAKLIQLGALVQSALATLVTSSENGNESLPPKAVFDAQRTILSAAGMLTEIGSTSSNRLLEVSTQYSEARALHIAAEKRIPNLLAGFDEEGVSIEELALKVGCDAAKLSRIMRCLCSIHIFREVQPDRFANNGVSAALVDNEPLRAYIVMFAFDIYMASDYLPRTLLDKETGPSYDVAQTAFQAAIGTRKPRWDWLEGKIKVKDLREGNCGTDGGLSAYPGPFGSELEKAVDDKADDELQNRPELPIFGLAMIGGDYPWESLGSALLVDVGGGVGGFKTVVWPKDNPDAIAQKRVKFCPHDFFQPNPVKNTDVYWLRYIMHDWSDDFCVMNTTLGSEELAVAPAPLPANWGYYTRYSHQRDLAIMALLNGIERTPRELRVIIEKSGLKMHKIWDCRSQVSLVGVVLPDAIQDVK
ncbi:O-methyltransferase A [Massarina eburnea CBS 473.64]|uniref:O-methyltransferase A n=1 Tax=Massarina eburnea CBS 473.64 TaxID=1395130 RepID=A0A6A6RS89_9PLEO|nr:O-methyltransferase A [Massarina eburnea CBS 473.64]